MPEILHVRHPRSNRKKAFEIGDLRLWVKPEGTWSGPLLRTALKLERFSRSKWRIIWSGSLRVTGDEVEIEQRYPHTKKQSS
jgi:hypothetical protein